MIAQAEVWLVKNVRPITPGVHKRKPGWPSRRRIVPAVPDSGSASPRWKNAVSPGSAPLWEPVEL